MVIKDSNGKVLANIPGDSATVRLEGCDLVNASLAGVDLSESTFDECRLDGVSFQGAVMNKSEFTACRFPNGVFRSCNMISARFLDCNLSNCDLSQICAEGILVIASSFVRAVLDRADLYWGTFVDCDLTGASLRQADIRGARFESCDLSNSDLTGIIAGRDNMKRATDLRGMRLNGALLDDVDLRETMMDWHGGGLVGAKYTKRTQFPEGVIPRKLGLVLLG
jgi:uncharacterized protein YjbI with pentapeptide repeats